MIKVIQPPFGGLCAMMATRVGLVLVALGSVSWNAAKAEDVRLERAEVTTAAQCLEVLAEFNWVCKEFDNPAWVEWFDRPFWGEALPRTD